MAAYRRPPLPLLLFQLSLASLTFPRSVAAAQPICSVSSFAFLDDLRCQCPRRIELSPPHEKVSGETLERDLNSSDQYYSVLFYASWCPFSHDIQPIFNALGTMFPQIKHMLVEESSVMPSVLSRNGIHSFPSVMLVNKTKRVVHHGPKDLTSLVHFYKKNTGLGPMVCLTASQHRSGSVKSPVLLVESTRGLITKEPCLAFSILFLSVKMIICFFSVIYSRFRSLWVSHAWHLKSRVLLDVSQLLEKVLHAVDIRMLWSKLRLCNETSNFQKGANNARAWASSLASVSLGESSSTRRALRDL